MATRHTSIAGRLLVAAPVLTDPNFDRSVVLMLTHDLGGALGLILNRLDPEIPSVALAPWVARGAAPRSLYEGGPVQRDGLIGLMGVAAGDVDAATTHHGFTPFVTYRDRTVGTVDLAMTAAAEDHPLLDTAAVRVFRGYSGWAPGQLDQELTRPGWLVVNSESADVFTSEPWNLWRQVLGRQATPMSWLARYPDDLSVN